MLVELDEGLLDGEAELLADNPLDLLDRDWRDVVLELAQLRDDVRRHDVGARGEHLAELDERRPELVEHLAQPPAAIRVELGVRCPAPVEEVSETVPGGDPPDLRDARKRPLRAVGRHRISAASSRDVVSLEQPQSMLELGDAEREVFDLLAAGEPRPRQRALHRLVPAYPDSLQLGPPRRDGIAHRLPHRVALDADPPSQVVCELLHRLDARRRQADPGKQDLGH